MFRVTSFDFAKHKLVLKLSVIVYINLYKIFFQVLLKWPELPSFVPPFRPLPEGSEPPPGGWQMQLQKRLKEPPTTN